MSRRQCCVPSCNSNDTKRYHIVQNPARRDIWLQRISNEKLFNVPEDSLKHYVICKSHFESKCIMETGKLVNWALPTLNLPHFQRKGDNDCFFGSPPSTSSSPVQLKKMMEQFETSSSNPEYWREEDNLEDLSMDWKMLSPKTYAKIPYTGFKIDDESGINVGASTSRTPDEAIFTQASTSNVPTKRKIKRRKYVGKEKELFMKINKLRKLYNRSKKRSKNLKRISYLQRSRCYGELFKKLNEPTLNFLKCQISNQKLKPKGRRFTIDDKIFALSLFKQGGKGYRFLSKFFSLPSRRTLSKLLENIPFNCGVNKHIFNNLKKCAEKLDNLDKNCILMFDEISLSPGISYNKNKDCVEGIVDFGNGDRRAMFADHALVFMLKGIKKKWKQPLAFFFCSGTTPTFDLVRLIKEIVRHVRQTGLEIVATVCDQGATNNSAINKLKIETNEYCIKNNIENKYHGYLVDGIEVVHLYDPPHLMKGLRNGLLSKDLHFTQDGKQKVASWSHIIQLYRIEQAQGKYSLIPKLTDEHVLPEKIKKMKVKCCTQVFSSTVATAMKRMAETSKQLPSNSPLYIDPLATETADLFMFLDELFDSVNGHYIHPPPGKHLLGVLTEKSRHVAKWRSSISLLETMYFQNQNSGRNVTPSIKNFISTLRGFIYLWSKLKNKGFKYLTLRSFNQDPLENFFSLIRSHGVRNVNPTCTSFISSFKSLIINNLSSTYSPSSNCEEDEHMGLLDNLKNYLTSSSGNNEIFQTQPPVIPQNVNTSFNRELDLATPYVAGAIARKIMKIVKCARCSDLLNSNVVLPQNVLIADRQYQGCTLIHPSESFINAFHYFTENTFLILPTLCNSFNVKKCLIEQLDNSIINNLFCPDHLSKFNNHLLEKMLDLIIIHFFTIVNRILKGKDLRFKDSNYLTKLAFEKLSKTRRR